MRNNLFRKSLIWGVLFALFFVFSVKDSLAQSFDISPDFYNLPLELKNIDDIFSSFVGLLNSGINFSVQQEKKMPPPKTPPPKTDEKPEVSSPPKEEKAEQSAPKKNFIETIIDKIKSIFVKEKTSPKAIPRKSTDVSQKPTPPPQSESLKKPTSTPPPTTKTEAKTPTSKPPTKTETEKPKTQPPAPPKETEKETETTAKPPPPPPTANQTKKTPAEPEKKEEPTKQPETGPEVTEGTGSLVDGFLYSDRSKRDPFVSLIDTEVEMGNSGKLDVGSLKLVGIVEYGSGGLMAMFQDKDNNALFMSEGDAVSGGKLATITKSKVVFKIIDIDNEEREISISLYKKEGEKEGE